LGKVGRERLVAAITRLEKAGARVLTGGGVDDGPCSHRPTLLAVSAAELVARPQALVIEAFGNATVLVQCASVGELMQAIACVPGALAASLYCARDGRDDATVGQVAAELVARAGRIIENRMPTGLAVTPPMQHGGPWPSAGPPFFSAVGMPWSILRFARRICFDGWSHQRLPACLRDENPEGRPWRFVDAAWTRGEEP
jgi:NADP-dependent aldehyde dehydrogenase